MKAPKWHVSHRAAKRALPIADAHYSRQKPGSPQFVPPGRCLVLLTEDADALWVSSWPFARYVKHAWAGAWINSFFRRLPHCPFKASELIGPAVAATRHYWGEPHQLGMVTFIDSRKVKPTIIRGVETHGYCYLKAGFKPAACPFHENNVDGCQSCLGLTKGGLIAFQMAPDAMPLPRPAIGAQATLFDLEQEFRETA